MANRAAGIFLSADFCGTAAAAAGAAVVVVVAVLAAAVVVGFVCGLVVVAGSSFGGCPNVKPDAGAVELAGAAD